MATIKRECDDMDWDAACTEPVPVEYKTNTDTSSRYCDAHSTTPTLPDLPPMSQHLAKLNVRSGGRCFYFTATLILANSCLEVTHVLADTGANASFLNRRVAVEAGLEIYSVEPKTFTMANNTTSTYEEMVRVFMVISGVYQEIDLWIDNSSGNRLMLFGTDAIAKFHFILKPKFVSKQKNGSNDEWDATVAQDKTRFRRRNIVVKEDDYRLSPSMKLINKEVGIRRCLDMNMIKKEYDASRSKARNRAKAEDSLRRTLGASRVMKESRYD